MKQLLKKFKNFRLTAIIEAILGAVVVIAALVLLILYQSNQTRFNPSTGEMINIPDFPGQPLAGMVFFLAGLLAIIFGVVAVYTSLLKLEMQNKLKKFIRNINDILFSCWDQLNNLLLGINNILKDSQDILLPKLNRLIPYFGAASAVFSIIEVIFAFMMTGIEGSRHTTGIIVVSIILILGLICQLAMLYPTITVRIVKDDE